jgi:hypothetical protein
MFFGVPAALGLGLAMIYYCCRAIIARRITRDNRTSWLFKVSIVGMLAILLLYSKNPNEPSVLLSLAVFASVVLATLGARPWLFIILSMLQILYWFVSPDALRIDYISQGLGRPRIAGSAQFDPSLQPGVLAAEAQQRPEFHSYHVAEVLAVPATEIWTQVTPEQRRTFRQVEDLFKANGGALRQDDMSR